MVGGKIWIIDDNVQMADCLKQYGNIMGYDVKTFELANDALEEILTTKGARPDVVVCDLNGKEEMGCHIGMDGNQFFLESYPALSGTLRYLLTASGEIPHIVNSMHIRVIQKPIRPPIFYKIISKDLGDLVESDANYSQ